jgi:5-hydroxyisourate hydrolase
MTPGQPTPNPRSPITTHVLDTALGKPAAGVAVQLLRDGKVIASGVTDANGRIGDLLPGGGLESGDYQLRFDTGAYARSSGRACFYPEVVVVFTVASADEHFHVPLILSPFGYSTYRGS